MRYRERVARLDPATRRNLLAQTWGDYPHTHELLPRLGFKAGQHLPADGFEPRNVDGVWFKCEPINPPQANGRRTSKHRLFYLCDCGAWVSAGRSMQHWCKVGKR